MWDRLKKGMHHFMNVVLALVLAGACGAYVLINSVIMASVINDLRLDTYVNIETGFEVVMLILMLGWVPAWLMRSATDRSRYVGRL